MNAKPKSLEEKIIHLEHLIEVLIKGQEQIKSHLWRQPRNERTNKSEQTDEEHNLKLQENEAINYVHNVIIPKTKGGIEVQGFWQGAVLNFLKQKALDYVGTTLKELVVVNLVDLSKWLLEQLEEQIINLYNKADEKEKVAFKNKLTEVYPDSPLLKKLV